MRPPSCVICNQTEGCDIVIFKKSQKQLELEKKGSADMAFNPPNQVWFCSKHLESAKKHNDLTADEALEEMK